MDFYQADISFDVNGKPKKFSVFHNLPEKRGLSINDALINWQARTKKFTARSFCNYIKSKDINFIALTQKEYDSIK